MKDDRVTFILLEKERLPRFDVKSLTPISGSRSTALGSSVNLPKQAEISDAEISAMVGDVNFYLILDPDSVDDVYEGSFHFSFWQSRSGRGLFQIA